MQRLERSRFDLRRRRRHAEAGAALLGDAAHGLALGVPASRAAVQGLVLAVAEELTHLDPPCAVTDAAGAGLTRVGILAVARRARRLFAICSAFFMFAVG